LIGSVRGDQVDLAEALIDGLAAAPKAFAAMLRGESFGKTVICLGPTG
jgi:NADPH-dependent curcumin reductase CurA